MDTTTTFLTAKDVANTLKISKALAYRLLSQGHIPSIKFGKTVRVSRQALEAFIQEKGTSQVSQDPAQILGRNI